MSEHTASAAEQFEPHRRALTGLAYRMLGSLAEAEDIVQDAYLRWHGADRANVENPRAFLTRAVSRLCLDQLKSARVRREEYVGPWLPEPVLDDAALDSGSEAEFANDLSVALMLMLERLSPLERAAFLLHDVFDFGFDEVAGALERTPEACRQLASRARTQVRRERPRFKPNDVEARRVLEAFAVAARVGDRAQLARLLAPDAVFYSDGGGRVTAAGKPIEGAQKIAVFLSNLVTKGLTPTDLQMRFAQINGAPGMILSADGQTLQTIALELREGLIAAIYVVRNPDKLKGIAS